MHKVGVYRRYFFREGNKLGVFPDPLFKGLGPFFQVLTYWWEVGVVLAKGWPVGEMGGALSARFSVEWDASRYYMVITAKRFAQAKPGGVGAVF